jgi:hypothetical protein
MNTIGLFEIFLKYSNDDQTFYHYHLQEYLQG